MENDGSEHVHPLRVADRPGRLQRPPHASAAAAAAPRASPPPGHAAAVRGPAGSGAPLRGPLHPALSAARRQPSPLRDGQSRGDGRAAERCAGGGGGAARGEGAGLPAHGGRTHRGGGEDAGGLVADALAAVAPGEVRGAAENAAREDRRRVAIPHFVQRALRRGVSCRPRSRGGTRSSAM
ncbi:uncharacterized protein [Blastocystis hominis]|uniref:Uncharacterized protein n=1 Tax=Blastocystis hominis TaxID=12968 RepID=D8M0T1_BLAHO|nr:uncharacterized protein [Blastocystis hominis]CBK21670.2 unnamed protein product [Blastocystis hominis]|eukprot:XP_012895718.1 uncharacterized protein [Blastocystis hominis]